MAQLSGVCPGCEQFVLFQAVPTGGSRVFKCSNCWHYLDDAELEHAQTVADALKEHDAKRAQIITGKR